MDRGDDDVGRNERKRERLGERNTLIIGLTFTQHNLVLVGSEYKVENEKYSNIKLPLNSIMFRIFFFFLNKF